MPACARSHTLPPLPPSPPSGPPKGTNFSRRKPMAPRPPWPAFTLTIASSTNFIVACRANEKPRQGRGLASSIAALPYSGRTLTKVRLSAPFFLNWTRPSFSANSVWSVPTPTLSPARYGVPRWRTRILPANTCSPPNFLTPSRFDWDSRPFLVLPPAFLCAMFDSSGRRDARHLHFGERLAVTLLAQVMLAAPELGDLDLVGLAVRLHGRRDAGARDIGRADGHVGALADQEDLVEFDGRTRVGVEFLDPHDGALAHPVLFSPGGNDGVHDCLDSKKSRQL